MPRLFRRPCVYNRSNTAQILPSAIIGDIHVSDSDSDTKFQAAATDTAEQLADSVITFLSSQAAFYKKASSHSPASSSVKLKRRLRSFFPDDANKEMDKAFGNQSLNKFLEHKFITGLIDDDRDVPTLGDTKLDPYSEVYKDKILAELRLNDNHELSDEQRTQLTDLIRRHGHVFMLPGAPFEGVDHTFHEIDTGDSQPQYTPPYPKSPAQLQIIKEEIQKMIEQDILEPSNSPWGAPCLLVKKKSEHGMKISPRLVVDYRKLNKVTRPDVYPLPNIQTLLDQLGGKSWFTKLDMFSGFWHIPIAPRDKEKTAVITHVGLFQFERLPFGLRNAPASFQRLVNTVFSDLLFPRDEVAYLSADVDDLLCHSFDWDSHQRHIENSVDVKNLVYP